MLKTLAIALLSITLLCAWTPKDVSSGPTSKVSDGKRYIRDLAQLIERADRIEVAEHSSPMDFLTPERHHPPPKEILYQRVVLTKPQKDGFHATIKALNPKTQNAFPLCGVVAHHRIEFFTDEKLIDSMEVCFRCGQVEWQGSSATPPWALYDGLTSFIKSIGLHPERDWRALAKASGQ